MSQTVAVKRATKEFADLQKNSAQHGMRAETINDDLMKWKCWIKGPVGSPYEGGTFELLVVFPTAFPYKPPTITFITKIYHCNIDGKGRICLDILKDQWAPSLTISKTLLSIVSLLSDPNPNDPLVPNIARMLRSNKEKHDKKAQECTKKYATN